MDDDAGCCWEFPTDVLVEILLRLPQSSRRRSRLVCRSWRDVVDGRTTEMRSRAKVLFWNAYSSVAYVVDDLSSSSTGSCTELWSGAGNRRGSYGLQLVASCNGVLCLCDNEKVPGGAITLVNPATGEALPVPPLPVPPLHVRPLPCAGMFDGIDRPNWWVYHSWDQAYTFAYHPISGQYKVVHVPSRFGEDCEFDAIQVLTLGEASWREVSAGPQGGARCDRNAGIISVDGTTYWTTEGSVAKVVSFDLEHDRITSFTPLPPRPKTDDFGLLTEVHGRLGIVIDKRDRSMTKEVWVLEKGRRWSRRYIVSSQYLPQPHFVYGDYVLTQEGSLYANYTWKDPSLSSDMVRISQQDQRTLVLNGKFGKAYYPNVTLAYVETTEPLSVYGTN